MCGLFIVFEGGEGSGKTTQAKLLYNYLKKKNLSVIFTYEPGGTKISNQIRKILLSSKNKLSSKTEIFLYLAARVQHIEEKIIPALEQGKIIICDRFSLSTFAYQGYGRMIDKKIIKLMNNFATSGLVPHLTILFDIPPEVGLKRIKKKKDRLEKEEINFHQNIRKGYLELAEKNKNTIKVFDGRKNKIFLHQKIVKLVEKLLK